MLHKTLLIAGVLIGIALFGSVFIVNHSTFAAKPITPASVEDTEMPLGLTTHVWGIFNPKSGDIVIGEGTKDVHPIASVAKLFTAYVVMESTRKNEPFTITYADVATEGRSGSLFASTKTTPYELLFPLLLESSNDAAVAIRRDLDDVYTEILTNTSKSLTLTQTHIADPSGLDPETVSSVTELARFFSDIKRHHQHILDITQLAVYVTDTEDYVNNNPGRVFKNFTGGKHGYTDQADHTFIGSFEIENSEIGIVLLDSKDLAHDIEVLTTYVETHLP
jgi:serine-type D-Ala-D-Ala carboxypeptidase (penicillin-binding protein 5/6)